MKSSTFGFIFSVAIILSVTTEAKTKSRKILKPDAASGIPAEVSAKCNDGVQRGYDCMSYEMGEYKKRKALEAEAAKKAAEEKKEKMMQALQSALGGGGGQGQGQNGQQQQPAQQQQQPGQQAPPGGGGAPTQAGGNAGPNKTETASTEGPSAPKKCPSERHSSRNDVHANMGGSAQGTRQSSFDPKDTDKVAIQFKGSKQGFWSPVRGNIKSAEKVGGNPKMCRIVVEDVKCSEGKICAATLVVPSETCSFGTKLDQCTFLGSGQESGTAYMQIHHEDGSADAVTYEKVYTLNNPAGSGGPSGTAAGRD